VSYASVVAADGTESQARRTLLAAAMERVKAGLPVEDCLGPGVDPGHLSKLLMPLARVDAHIDWLAVNDERVDAVLNAGETQWRVVFGSSTGETIDRIDVYERPSRFDGIAGGRAVIINGPSGAGKSTLMHALQQIADTPFVVFDEPEHVGTVQPGYLIWRDRAPALHRGYLDAIAALARAGNHVAVPAAGRPYVEFVMAFGGTTMLTIGLTCDQQVLLERERRTGRWGGIATESATAHDGWTYDIEFDTTNHPDPIVMARTVLDRI